MSYRNLSFDYTAVFGYMIVYLWTLNEKRIPTRSYRVFRMLLATSFSAALLEILATMLVRSIDTTGYPLFFTVLSLQTLFINFVPLFFLYYVLLLAHYDLEKSQFRLVYRFILAVEIVIVVLNPLLGDFAFAYVNDRYRVMPAGIAIYLIDAAALAYSVYIMIRYHKNFLFIKPIPLAFIFVCGVVSCVGQVVFNVPLLNLMVMTVNMTLYHYQQNSSMVTDGVTGLFNRQFMGEYIRNLYYDGRPFGVIMVSMDDFKFINKTYGVTSGDQLLRQVGLSLERMKVPKTVFRFGSDQFCVVLSKKTDALGQTAERIQSLFHEPWCSDSSADIMLSASICCMECPRDAATYRELVEVIDYSTGEAKRLKKGQVTDISEIDLDKVKREKAIEKAVRHAMERDSFMVYYQPIYSVEKKGYHSAEALVRLEDEELGWISPEDFIPIAEKNGLIVELGESILTKVCRFISENRLWETTIEFIEVNLSPLQLLQVNFAERAKKIMDEYGVRPEQINFEITETAAINSMPTLMGNISKLVDYGISFSLDDYGSGYANINYINNMAFSIIKIDKEMLWESFKNAKAKVTLEYSIAMLNALKLCIVAEGVETAEMRDKLIEFGCHYLQGWYFSKAVSGEEFIKLVNEASGYNEASCQNELCS